MQVIDNGNAMLINASQSLKAYSPMRMHGVVPSTAFRTRCHPFNPDARNAIVVNELHPAKAELPMLVTDVGSSRLANAVHLLKEESSILVTEDGMVTAVTVSASTPHSSHELRSPRQCAPAVTVAVPSGMAKCIPPRYCIGAAPTRPAIGTYLVRPNHSQPDDMMCCVCALRRCDVNAISPPSCFNNDCRPVLSPRAEVTCSGCFP